MNSQAKPKPLTLKALAERIEHAENCIESDAINPEDVESLKRQADGIRNRVDVLEGAKAGFEGQLSDQDRELSYLDGKVLELARGELEIRKLLFGQNFEGRLANGVDARMDEFEKGGLTLAARIVALESWKTGVDQELVCRPNDGVDLVIRHKSAEVLKALVPFEFQLDRNEDAQLYFAASELAESLGLTWGEILKYGKGR
jgi:hypothetical protein